MQHITSNYLLLLSRILMVVIRQEIFKILINLTFSSFNEGNVHFFQIQC